MCAMLDPPGFEREIVVAAGDAGCPAIWSSQSGPAGWSSSRMAAAAADAVPGNRFVAAALNEAGLGTLLVDLLTPQEELSRANVFNVRLLAALTCWRSPDCSKCPLMRPWPSCMQCGTQADSQPTSHPAFFMSATGSSSRAIWR
jgi:hypothetical protein